MPFSLAVHPTAAYLRIAASGPAQLPELCGFMDLAATVALRRGFRRLVLDLLEVEVDLSFTDHLQLGAFAADRLRNVERVASVVPARYRTGSSEKAAQKSGLNLRTFTEMQPALDWLGAPH